MIELSKPSSSLSAAFYLSVGLENRGNSESTCYCDRGIFYAKLLSRAR